MPWLQHEAERLTLTRLGEMQKSCHLLSSWNGESPGDHLKELGVPKPHNRNGICAAFKASRLVSLLRLASLALRMRLLFWLFLHVRIKTEGGERNPQRQCTTIAPVGSFPLASYTSWRFCLCAIYFLSTDLSKVASGKDWRLQCPPHNPYRKWTKSMFT